MSDSDLRNLSFELIDGIYAAWMTWRRADGSLDRRLVSTREACAFGTAYQRALGALVAYMESSGEMSSLNVADIVSNVDALNEPL